MDSPTRIFVKGLPPKFSETELRKHFSQNDRLITDIKYFPDRRFGYVGFKTHEDAQAVVKYFNRTYVRMSRIGVELARPIEERAPPTARKSVQDTVAPSTPSKRKREVETDVQDDPKLKEFLEAYKSKSKRKEAEDALMQDAAAGAAQEDATLEVPTADSDDEYEQVPKKAKRSKPDVPKGDEALSTALPAAEKPSTETVDQAEQSSEEVAPVSDADWARSRTSRLLGLLDDEEERPTAAQAHSTTDGDDEVETISRGNEVVVDEPASSIPTPPADEIQDKDGDTSAAEPIDAEVEAVRKSMRLFVRNLPYDAQKEDLEAEFERFGNLEEVHIALDKKTGTAKGFAFIQYSDPDSSEQAFVDRDGQTFQGRLLHILPGTAKREDKLNDFDLSKLPLKKQNEIRRRREAASSTFNWNALYMNTDAVVSSVARRLGLAKSEVLDPTSSDAAVKQAHAETHIIQETKSYFRQQGVDLDSFKKSHRGDTAILVKNIPADCSKDELKRLFEEQGDVHKFLMPPAGTIAIVEFANAAQCKAAFGTLAYRRVKSSMLFLEKAPKDLFTAKPASTDETGPEGVSKVSTADFKDADHTVPETTGTVTLFVRNLNFSTTTKILSEAFTPLDGFLSARVKTREDPKRGTLSMGFGFAEFRSTKQAQAALETMDGYTLEGHKLQVRASHKGADAAEERRKADVAKRSAARSTKIIIKNLPFETTKKDVRALFGAYGQLRSVRVPKKIDRAARGFAFAEFTTAKEAQSAMDALRDTHLLGRRLVLDFAAEETEDAEAAIEKMQQKVGAQVNKVALQKLTSGGRKKFTTSGGDEEVD
ncbi:hypothetical protein DOTSEDRAFT_168162 [Dothistroma septosporum NZE10]|uniref:Multiple RNA-binding domain-containing protein 1 n=1 Tax=Dothistroma septosporum (strain NZE10 / CBS 128990) TaxID=675120 RepID=N1PU57_DOTSN|nr:hypothetical protein DOTSEDRAFT_168162 [Dothistroma septosporum NZE10]